MESERYLCNRCHEQFELVDFHSSGICCPRCGGEEVEKIVACGLEKGTPPWEYLCKECSARFRVKAPRGPSEEKEIRCPACRSRNLEWLTAVSEACPPGG